MKLLLKKSVKECCIVGFYEVREEFEQTLQSLQFATQ